jgi:DAK2 domain fusion protein YloV
MGARGNSGIILSQILRGLADTFSELDVVSGADVAAGLRRAADAAYQAVLRPVEGTILTVVRAAAESVERALGEGETTLAALLERAAEAAREAVAATPDLLPVLRDAGVVDAGGRGFELLLAACLHVVAERPLPAAAVVHRKVAVRPQVEASSGAAEAEVRVGDLRYEVMFFLDAPDEEIDGFKTAWGALGDSIVVVGGEGLWNCHVHTDDIGGAVEAAIAVGRPRDIRITDLLEQAGHHEDVLAPDSGTAPVAPVALVAPTVQVARDAVVTTVVTKAVTTAVVAVAVGDGLHALLRSLGVQQVVAGGQSMNPSTATILEAVDACTAEGVVVLPNNKNIVAVARQVPDLADVPVAVIPTATVVEALGALVAYDPDAPLDVNQAAMAEAAARVRAGEVTQAVRDSVAECGPIAVGDWMAITRDGIQAAVKSAVDAAIAVVDALADDDAELVTLIVGADADADDTAQIAEHVAQVHPHVEVEVHRGDQPLYPYLVGVE